MMLCVYYTVYYIGVQNNTPIPYMVAVGTAHFARFPHAFNELYTIAVRLCRQSHTKPY